jgi:two-component system NarL family sensor kinase
MTQHSERRFRLSIGQKVFLLATVPLLLAVTAISLVVLTQSRQLAEREIKELETQLIGAKREELLNYISIARTAIVNTYGRAAPDDDAAKLHVSQTLSSLLYGQDGYFFVYDYDGNNLVGPRRTDLIGQNWTGMTDDEGTPITDEIIRIARSGGGYHSFNWTKPSNGETGRMAAYVVGLQDWKWAIGTGIFIDDVLDTVAAARADVESRIQRTFYTIIGITVLALLGVFLSGLFLNIRERRLADAKLKNLTQRIIDTQEEERARVARELHDSISQSLVGVRYALDLARRLVLKSDARAEESLNTGIESLAGAIQEVRRISRDLRPGVLDDLGLGPALKALIDDFSKRTNITFDFETAVFRNRLDQESKIAFYRIAQEALTNIERHAEASHVSMSLFGGTKGATLRIADDGVGIKPKRGAKASDGLGLRNMQERVEQLNGSLLVLSQRVPRNSGPDRGTIIEARVPLSHMLPPDPQKRDAL